MATAGTHAWKLGAAVTAFWRGRELANVEVSKFAGCSGRRVGGWSGCWMEEVQERK